MSRARPCMVPRCPNVVTSTRPYCPDHKDRGDYGPTWERIKREHLDLEPNCRSCGALGEAVDHITPRSQGGTDDHSNLQTLCTACHGEKTWRIG